MDQVYRNPNYNPTGLSYINAGSNGVDALSGGTNAANSQNNYSGSGYLKMKDEGAMAQFSVNALYTGNYSVNLRYCNGNDVDKTLSIYVNGVKVKQIELFNYHDWDKWAERYDNIQLRAGSNTITYKYDSGDTRMEPLFKQPINNY